MARNIAVPFRGGHFMMTSLEAKQLVANITSALARDEMTLMDVRAPNISEDGYMNRADFYDFFSQFEQTDGVLRAHAGNLFGRIVTYGKVGTIPFTVRCLVCKQPHDVQHRKTKCVSFGYKHCEVGAVSIKEYADCLMNRRNSGIGPSVVRSMQLLVAQLP